MANADSRSLTDLSKDWRDCNVEFRRARLICTPAKIAENAAITAATQAAIAEIVGAASLRLNCLCLIFGRELTWVEHLEREAPDLDWLRLRVLMWVYPVSPQGSLAFGPWLSDQEAEDRLLDLQR